MGISIAQARAWNIPEEKIQETLAKPGINVEIGGKGMQPTTRIVEPRPIVAKDGPNKTESLFAMMLCVMKGQGEIRDWAFEPEKFRLADRTYYTPDFRVTLNDWRNCFVEVKVARKDGGTLWRDDAAVKVKTVAELHPYVFLLAVRHRSRWEITRLPSRQWSDIPDPGLVWRI